MRILIILGCLALLPSCESGSSAMTVGGEIIRPAKIMSVERANNEILHEFPARVEALQSVDLSFEVGGPLAHLPIREGETLTKGSLVAALDPTDFELAVRESEVQLKLAAQDLDRKSRVLQQNGIAKSQVEDARSLYELQRIRLSKAIERLQDSKIKAPFDAFVARRFFDRHVNVKAGEPIARLLDQASLQVVFNAPGQLLASTSPESLIRAWAEFSFAPGEEFELTYFENRGEATSLAQTYEVSFTMENPSNWNILPGMTAKAKLRLRSSAGNLILIPASAVVPTTNSALSVWVYEPKTQLVSQRRIETGAPQTGGVTVMSGLEHGEKIVVTGASHLQTGMRIEPL